MIVYRALKTFCLTQSILPDVLLVKKRFSTLCTKPISKRSINLKHWMRFDSCDKTVYNICSVPIFHRLTRSVLLLWSNQDAPPAYQFFKRFFEVLVKNSVNDRVNCTVEITKPKKDHKQLDVHRTRRSTDSMCQVSLRKKALQFTRLGLIALKSNDYEKRKETETLVACINLL